MHPHCQKRQLLKIADLLMNDRSQAESESTLRTVVQDRAIARIGAAIRPGRLSEHTINAFALALRQSLLRSRRSPIALQQAAERLIADDFTDHFDDRFRPRFSRDAANCVTDGSKVFTTVCPPHRNECGNRQIETRQQVPLIRLSKK